MTAPFAGFTELRMVADPRCRLADLRAFLASYAVKVERNGLTFHHTPVFMTFGPLGITDMKTSPNIPPYGTVPSGSAITVEFDVPSESSRIGRGIVVTLTECSEPGDESSMHEDYRWPFHVSERLEVVFTLRNLDPLGDLWWKFVFEPGQQYQERTNP